MLGIGEGAIAVAVAAIIITVIKTKHSGKTNEDGTCPLHGTLVEDIREIKEDVKTLIKEVAGMGRNI